MFVITRKNERTGKAQYLCKDSARIFWRSRADKHWLAAYHHKEIAEMALNTVKANYMEQGYTYSVIKIPYSISEMKYINNKSIDGGIPEKDITII